MNQQQTDLLNELTHYNWGTIMPVALMIGENIVSLRARGYFNASANDPLLFDEKINDVDEFRGRMRSVVPLWLSDILGEASLGKSNLDEVVMDWQGLEMKLKSMVSADLEPLGLMVDSLKIEAIEEV